jgi:hypothetical protein
MNDKGYPTQKKYLRQLLRGLYDFVVFRRYALTGHWFNARRNKLRNAGEKWVYAQTI